MPEPDASKIFSKKQSWFGNIDTVYGGVIYGWAKSTENDEPISVDIVVNGHTIARSLGANIYREDLLDAGIGTGGYAFHCKIPNFLDSEKEISIIVFCSGSREFSLNSVFKKNALSRRRVPLKDMDDQKNINRGGKTISIGAIFKNEAPYILEWIAFHRLIGVDKFFIFDNNSNDGTTEILAALHKVGIVQHTLFPGQAMQIPAYREILRLHKNDAGWIAFIDADEFIMPTSGKTFLPDFLNALPDDVGAVALNWAVYGSSGRREPGKGPVLERFTKRGYPGGVNGFYKTILRPSSCDEGVCNPHHFPLKKGFRYVHADRSPVLAGEHFGISKAIIWDYFKLNHYVIKSLSEFLFKKRARGLADQINQKRDYDFFFHHDCRDVNDPVAPDLLAKVKEEVSRLKDILAAQGVRGQVLHCDDALSEMPLQTPFSADQTLQAVGEITKAHVAQSSLVVEGWSVSRTFTPQKLSARLNGTPLKNIEIKRFNFWDIGEKYNLYVLDAGFSCIIPLSGCEKTLQVEIVCEEDDFVMSATISCPDGNLQADARGAESPEQPTSSP